MSEIIDIFDGNHRRIGQCERTATHRQGLWHQTFHCWIVNNRGESGSVLLQLRSALKASYPGMLDITAAGHLQADETPMDGLRELEEELGVQATPERLVPLGIKHDVMDTSEGVQNREFSHVYLLRDDRKLEDYTLQEDEVSGLVELSIDDGLALFGNRKPMAMGNAICLEGGTKMAFERAVCVTDLIPRVDSYYLKVFIMAQLFLEGHKYLSI